MLLSPYEFLYSSLVIKLQLQTVQFVVYFDHFTETTIQYDTRCYFNVHSKADMSQINLPHGTDN